MKQFDLENNVLKLKVKQSSFFTRLILFVLAFVFFLIPIAVMVTSIIVGNGFHFGFLISTFIFSLMGLFLLRLALWNSFGEEIYEFNLKEVSYQFNYGWYKEQKKVVKMDVLLFSFNSVGYEGDKIGTIVIGVNDSKINSVVKMPVSEIEELITKLNIIYN